MVGPYYHDAYAMLEQSFHSQSRSHPLRHLPRKRVASAPIRMNPSSLESSTQNRACSPQLRNPDIQSSHVSTLQPPVRLDLGLPPTPPSNIPSESPEPHQNRTVDTDGIGSSLMSQKSGPSTPINQRSPPTPETTPPHNRHLLSLSRPSLKSHTPSSLAGSFRTAREDISIDDGDGDPYARSDVSAFSHSEAWSHSEGRRPGQPVPEIGLGLNFEYMEGEGTSAESTPAEQYPGPENTDDAVEGADLDRPACQDGNWDSHHFENIVELGRTTITDNEATDIAVATPVESGTTAAGKHSQSLEEETKDQVERNGQRSPSPNTKKPVDQNAQFSPVYDSAHVKARQEEQKRLSSTSTVSNIVEAMVLSSPATSRPQHRSLRRMGKNVSLRTRERPFENNFPPASQVSRNMPVHRLVHKNSPIPERRTRESQEIDLPARTMFDPERPRPDSVTLAAFPRPPSAPRAPCQRPSSVGNSVPQIKQLPPGLDRVGLGYFDIAKGKPPPPSEAPRKNESRPRDSPSVAQISSAVHDVLANHDEDPAIANYSKFLRYASQQSVQHPSPAPNRGQPHILPHSQKDPRQDEFNEDLKLDELGLPIMGTRVEKEPSPDSERQSIGLDTSQNLQPHLNRPRRSLETALRFRDSRENLPAPDSDHSLARHVHARTSPHSEASTEQPDTLEVSQATAVSIYPHNNNSLLVVQQLARPAAAGVIERRRTISSLHSGTSTSPARTQSRAVTSFPAMASPSIPSEAVLSTVNADDSSSQVLLSCHLSPITTQRLGPQPPAFKIIPPTPLSEIESPHSPIHPRAPAKVIQLTGPGVPTNASHTNHSTPGRRLSLRQRARRLSEPIIQPLLHAKAQLPLPGNKNRYNLHTNLPSVPSVSDVPQETNKLHPFWRPRGFWDDFSDSGGDEEYVEDDGEAEDEEPGFLVAGRHATIDRHSPFFDPDLDGLPLGGDTSNVGSSPPFSASKNQFPRLSLGAGSLGRRLGGFGARNTGEGFLIGNSLGIKRQPSNSRKHVVTLPAALRARLTTATARGRFTQNRDSILDWNVSSGSLKQMKRQAGLSPRTRWSTKYTTKTPDRAPVGLSGKSDRDAEKLGFRVPTKLEGVKEMLVTMRKEKRKKKLKSRIGKIELIEDRSTAQIW